ncbi:MAG TPA: type II toxin-antitoxin system RelE/ParE family toxin [Nitrospirae bacterium]|nr:type II toxin-antitoxin system RelE/ParE family toxin [Nitrospirota bacterium]
MIDTGQIYKGRKHAIHGLVVNGKCRIIDFIEGLEEPDKKKVIALLKRTADLGLPKNTEKFKSLKGSGLYEFKSYQVRILCFFDREKVIILTHGFIKKRDKTPKREITKAEKLMREYSVWRKKE